MTYESSRLTFEVISSILFGEEFLKESLKITYIEDSGSPMIINIHDALDKINEDCARDSLLPLNMMFP